MIDDEVPRTISDPAPPRTAKRKTKKQRSAESATNVPVDPTDYVWVGSAGVWVPQAWPAMHPLVGQLVSEDLSWRIGVLLWRSSRPHPLSLRARARWRAHGMALAAKRERLRAAARELGFRPSP